MIFKNTIKDIVATEISGRSMALSNFNTAAVSKNIEDSFFKKYKIDIGDILGGKFYKINTRGELKFAIDDAKDSTLNLNDMKAYLKENYRIEMKSDGKDFLFKHPEDSSFIRGSVLGKEYEAKSISGYFLEKYKNRKTYKKDLSRERKNSGMALDKKNKVTERSKGICMER